jgi:hypothetical protein
MLKVKVSLVYLKLNSGEFTKAVLETLQTQSRQAARAWLRAVILKVPTWTGEARGSLKPLGSFLNVAIPISPSTSRQAQAAMAAGHTAEAGTAQGNFQFKIEGEARVIFIFSTDVVHYLINEFYDVSEHIHLIDPVPWYSLRAGKAAYKEYLTTNLKAKIPKLKSYIFREVRDIGSLQ